MRLQSKTVAGQINKKGKLSIEMNALADFLNQNAGRDLTITLQVEPKEPSAAMKSYYYNSVLYDIQEGLMETGVPMSIKQVDQWLRDMSVFSLEEKIHDNKIIQKTLEISEMSDRQMYWFLFDVQRLAAEVNVTIKEPFCFTKKIITNEQTTDENQNSR
jgi:hypothetical protein